MLARPGRLRTAPQRMTGTMPDTHKKILCIEDDRETAALIAEELVDRGYDVTRRP